MAVVKSVEVEPGTFLMHVKASVSRGAALPTTLVWGPGPGDSDSQTTRGAIKPEAWPRHLGKMCDFWSSTLLRTGRYDGRPLPPQS